MRATGYPEIDDFRDNWLRMADKAARPTPLPMISFLTPQQKAKGTAEARQLAELGGGRSAHNFRPRLGH